MLADLIDLHGRQALGKKWKTYDRRPTSPEKNKQRMGDVAGRTPTEVRALLAAAREGRMVQT